MNTNTRRSALIFLVAALAFAVNMLGTTLPTPLYTIYQDQLGFSQLMITVIYAIYAVGVIAALIVTGSWSDQIGRRPMLAFGLSFSAASAVAFIWGGALLPLLIGRFLSGISAGIFTGTATVAVVELAPRARRQQATLVATAANMGGLGLGPLLAGIMAEYAPAPLLLPFAVDLSLVALAFVAIALVPETAQRPERPRLSIRKPGLPPAVRAIFIPAALANFAGFAVLGMFAAVAPEFLVDVLGYNSLALAGVVVFLLFAASTIGQSLEPHFPRMARLPAGCVALIIGAILVIISIATGSFAALLAGGILGGLGQGLAFRAGMGEITLASPPARRAEVASSFFVVAYVAISVPVVGIGLLARTMNLASAGIVFSIVVALLALVAALVLVLRPPEMTRSHSLKPTT